MSVYGGFSARDIDYPTYVGLVLNIPRIRMTTAVAVLQGLSAQKTSGSLDLAWFDALAQYPEEIEAIRYDVNAARVHAAALRNLAS